MMVKKEINVQILLFEDDELESEKIKKRLKSLVDESTDIKDIIREELMEVEQYHERVSALDDYIKSNNIGLVILDQEITKYAGRYVSPADITQLCKLSGIPLLAYSNNESDMIDRIKKWGERRILIDEVLDPEEIATFAANIFNGFKLLSDGYTGFREGSNKNPFDILFEVMKAPESSHTQIKLYATGYFDVMPENDEIEEEMKKHFPTLLGYWIYNSLFRFPGVLLNEVAAASYLGIDEEKYSKNEEIRNLFAEALYTGPLGELRKYWWKDKLDTLLAEAEIEDEFPGLIYLKKNEITDVNPVKCSHDGEEGAGYYCIISSKPVCDDHSEGNISWLPSGASLSRISHKVMDKLGPWYPL